MDIIINLFNGLTNFRHNIELKKSKVCCKYFFIREALYFLFLANPVGKCFRFQVMIYLRTCVSINGTLANSEMLHLNRIYTVCYG